MPTAPPAGWYVDPSGQGGQRYWDGEGWTKHRRRDGQRPTLAAGARRRWNALPLPIRVLLPLVLVLALVGIGYSFTKEKPRDDWAQLPARLTCHTQDGPTPPENITVSTVEVKHSRSDVLQLVVRFAKPLPASPTRKEHETRFVGYILTYSVANLGNGASTKFAELGPEQDTDDLAISGTLANQGESRIRSDKDTNARRIAPDTIQILLDLKRLGIENQPVLPELTLNARFDTPSTTTVQFAAQVCNAG